MHAPAGKKHKQHIRKHPGNAEITAPHRGLAGQLLWRMDLVSMAPPSARVILLSRDDVPFRSGFLWHVLSPTAGEIIRLTCSSG